MHAMLTLLISFILLDRISSLIAIYTGGVFSSSALMSDSEGGQTRKVKSLNMDDMEQDKQM